MIERLRLTHKRCNGIKDGYWTTAKKGELIARLAQYEDTYVPPEKIRPEWDGRCIEPCPYCGNEVHILWHVLSDGYEIYCPYCGNAIMLCDECTHADDYQGYDWEEGKGCWRKRRNENESRD